MIEKRLVLALLILTATSVAFAQQRGVYEMRGQLVGILFDPLVRQELILDEEQEKQAILAYEAQMARNRENAKRVRVLNLDRAGIDREFFAGSEKSIREYTKDLRSFLKPEQFKRLREITFERLRGESFSDPSLQDDLKMTDEQRAKVREIWRIKSQKARQAVGLNGDPKNARAIAAVVRGYEQEQLDSILVILTEDQRKQWDEMQGPPFGPG